MAAARSCHEQHEDVSLGPRPGCFGGLTQHVRSDNEFSQGVGGLGLNLMGAGEPHECFVHQRCGLERVATPAATHAARRLLPQLCVQD